MALETSASKQEGGIQPGCFFLYFVQNWCIFSKAAGAAQQAVLIPLGLLQHPHGWKLTPPTCRQAQAASVFPPFSPLLQSPTFTINAPGIFCLSDKPHQQITDIKDVRQIWKWSFKPQNEWREEITFQLLSPPLAGQAKASIF